MDDLCGKVMEVMRKCLEEMVAEVEKQRSIPLFHEVMLHIRHFKQRLKKIKVSCAE